MPFALHVAANEYRIASRYTPASLPAKRVLSDDGNASIEAFGWIVVDNQSEILQELFEFRFNGQRIGNGLRDQ